MASEDKLKQIVEAALLAAGRPLSLDQIQALFEEKEQPEKKALREVMTELMQDYEGRGIEVIEVGSGFRIQVRAGLSPWVSRLWAERPPKYSRALLETLALIAYRQPITRGEIEDVRGVSVSSSIIKTLMERHWIKEVGHRDVPGRPALLATTKEFLNYFGLKSLDELPTLAEIKDLDSINRELDLEEPNELSADPEGEVQNEEETTEQGAEIVKLDISQEHSKATEEEDVIAEVASEPEEPEEPEFEPKQQDEKESE
jgi:segregation and condensation protein B